MANNAIIRYASRTVNVGRTIFQTLVGDMRHKHKLLLLHGTKCTNFSIISLL